MEEKTKGNQKKKERRIFAGYYKRFNDFSFYIVDVVPDLETKKRPSFAENPTVTSMKKDILCFPERSFTPQ